MWYQLPLPQHPSDGDDMIMITNVKPSNLTCLPVTILVYLMMTMVMAIVNITMMMVMTWWRWQHDHVDLFQPVPPSHKAGVSDVHVDELPILPLIEIFISIWIRLLGSLSIRQTIVILYARFSDSNTTSFISSTSLPVLLVHVEAPVRSRLEEIFPESWICREGSAGWLNYWNAIWIHECHKNSRNVERNFFQIHCSQ